MSQSPISRRPSLGEEPQAESAAESTRSRRQVAMMAIGVVALIVAAFIAVRGPRGLGQDPAAASQRRPAIDAQSGEAFPEFRVGRGETQPWKNPKTGERSLYPAELCYWQKDGTVTLEPTYVLLNEYAGKTGDTICPACGRKVVPHNPAPMDQLSILAEEALRSGKR
jgi:hypothetical protein